MPSRYPSRRAATVVEFAIVAPVTLLLIIGLLVGGLGIFRYQQVAMLAHEGARWASVHGADYAKESGLPAATADAVYQNAIQPAAVGLDFSKLSYTVTWNSNNSPSRTTVVNGESVTTSNVVTVTVNYTWMPEAYLGGIAFSSTSSAVMAY